MGYSLDLLPQLTTILGQGTTEPSVLLGYLDPGSGSMFLQIMIASLLSGMFFLRTSIASIKAYALRTFSKTDQGLGTR
ncbi:hypothetical protein ACYOEI_06780 [Singulisphaera rosea]